jgi:hypothetical protein
MLSYRSRQGIKMTTTNSDMDNSSYCAVYMIYGRERNAKHQPRCKVDEPQREHARRHKDQ